MSTPPGAWLPLWLSTAHSLSRLHPWYRRLRAFLAEAPLLSASAKNRFGLRVDRLQPTLTPVLRDFPRKLRVHYGFHSLRPQTIFDCYTLAITDTSGYAYGVGPLPFRCQPETSACFSEPSMTCCRAPSSICTCAILTAALLPPIEEEAAYILRPRHVLTVHRPRRRHHTPLQGRADLSPTANGKDCIVLPTRNVEIALFTHLPPSVVCVLGIASPEHLCSRLRFSPL